MPKYGALGILVWMLKLVAVLIAVVRILGLISSFFFPISLEFYRLSRSIGAVWMIVAILMAFPLWCYADVLQVFMDIEENTRKTLEKITAGQEAQR